MDFQGDGDMLPIEVTDWAPNPEQLYWASELRHILTQTLEAVRPPLLGMLPKLVQVLEGLQKGFLNRVLRIFPVTRNALGDSEKFAIVSVYELLESSDIPILAGMDEIQVGGRYRPHFELCRVCRHNCSPRFGEQPLCYSKWNRMEMEGRFRCSAIWKSGLIAPRPCRSSSDGPSSSRDTFPPWRMCRRTFRPCPSLWS